MDMQRAAQCFSIETFQVILVRQNCPVGSIEIRDRPW